MVASLDGGGQRLPSPTKGQNETEKMKKIRVLSIFHLFYLLEEAILLNVSLTTEARVTHNCSIIEVKVGAILAVARALPNTPSLEYIV